MKRTDLDPLAIGSRIRKAREAKGLPQRAVADPLMATSYLSLIESGKRVPSKEMLDHIAARLDLDPQEILTGRPPGFEAELELRLSQARHEMHQGIDVTAELEDVERAAAEANLTRTRAAALTLLGTAAERVGRPDAARTSFERAIETYGDLPAHLRFEAVAGSARTRHATGEPRAAVHMLETYLIELERNGIADPTAKMRIYASLVASYWMLGLRERAAEAAEQALRLAPRVEDAEQIACMNMNVARVLLSDGRYNEALEALRRAETVYQSLDWATSRAWALLNRGIAQYENGELDESRATLEEALELIRGAGGTPVDQVYVLNQLGHVERLAGRFEEARRRLSEAAGFMQEADLLERAFNAREMGLCCLQDDPERAERDLREAIELYRKGSADQDRVASALDLARLLRAGGDLEAAFAVVEQEIDTAPV